VALLSGTEKVISKLHDMDLNANTVDSLLSGGRGGGVSIWFKLKLKVYLENLL
jgi:hypothetical protein